MKVKDFNNLKVGDKVRIVSTKTGSGWNSLGAMDKWLGKVMTIREIMHNCIRMEDDKCEHEGSGFYWYPCMIDKKIDPNRVKAVKRHAKPGEYIKIIEPCMTFGCYNKGDILKVSEDRMWLFTSDTVKCIMPNGEELHVVLDKEYVVLENYIPEEKTVMEVKRKAKVGEWIKVTQDKDIKGAAKKGDILKVYKIADDTSRGQDGGVYCELPEKCSSPYRHDNGNLIILDSEYVVLENYIPEEKVEEKKTEFATYTKSCIDAFREAWKNSDANPTIVEHLVKDRKTIVKLSNGNVGVAVCSPEDKFDIYEGLRLATERAYGKAEPYKKPSEVKEVKRHAKVGEYIKIVNPTITCGHYNKGDILKVARDNGYPFVHCDVPNRINPFRVDDEEYVVLENYKPNKK